MLYVLPAILLLIILLGIFLAESQWIVPVDPRYDAIFENAGIQHLPDLSGKNTMHFAAAKDGIVYCADYRYRNDTVTQWIETIYIPISQYTYTQKQELLQTVKTRFAAKESLPFCVTQYNLGQNYLKVTCAFFQVDKAEHFKALYDCQLIAENRAISMTSTRNTLLQQGFLKK